MAEPARESAIRVFCVDDNEFVGEALSRRARREAGIEWTGWIPSGAKLDEAVRKHSPDVILMDIDLPDDDSFALVQGLAARYPHVRVVMFSGHKRADYAERALNVGAWGFVSKEDDTDRVFQAVRMVSQGQVYLSAGVLEIGHTPESEQGKKTNAEPEGV